MSSNLLLAVGHRCAPSSKIAANSPYCVNVWPIGEDGKEVLVGTYVQKEFACDVIDLANFDKDAVLKQFEDFKALVAQVSIAEEFNSPKAHKTWLEAFNKASVSIVVMLDD